MPITHAQIAPLLHGTYTSREDAWRVIEDIVIPQFSKGLARLAPKGCPGRDFVHEVLCAFVLRVIEERGSRGPKPPPPADYTAWLRTVLLNKARDRIRTLAKPREVPLTDNTRPHDTTEISAPIDPEVAAQRLADIMARSPLYVVGLFAWVDPSRIDRALLELAAAIPRRGSGAAGLARSVDETLALLRLHAREISDGADRNAAVRDRLAWILRSDAHDFHAWLSDRRSVKAACETIYAWNKRARQRAPEEDA